MQLYTSSLNPNFEKYANSANYNFIISLMEFKNLDSGKYVLYVLVKTKADTFVIVKYSFRS